LLGSSSSPKVNSRLSHWIVVTRTADFNVRYLFIALESRKIIT